LSANHTLSNNVSLAFTQFGSWNVSGAFTLTIPQHVDGTLSQHFSGNGTIKFGVMQPLVPVEWFGAIANDGTDDGAKIQLALNSLSAGQIELQTGTYRISSPLNIITNSVGIKGHGMRITNTGQYLNTTPASIILNTAASTDSIDVFGTDVSHNVAFNKFEDFNVERSVLPTGTAAGISLNFTYGVTIVRVGIQDAVRGIYIHGSGSQGMGVIEDSTIQWGYNGVAETSGSFYGIYTDSADGIASPSFRVRHCFVANAIANGTTLNTFGAFFNGTALNDQMYYGFETAHLGYGVSITQTGAGSNIASSDLHFFGTINDAYYHGGFIITGLTTAGSGHVSINGGYNSSANSNTSAIDIESSRGVNVTNVQLSATTGNANNAIFVNNSTNVVLMGNDLQSVTKDGIIVGSSSSVVISGNSINGVGALNGLIRLVSTTLSTVTGNVLTGTGQSLVVDAASINNTGLASNTIAATLTAAVVTGANQINAWGAAPSGACINGSFSGNNTTVTGTFPSYQCRNSVWVGIGTVY
jgi:hypothetical protein